MESKLSQLQSCQEVPCTRMDSKVEGGAKGTGSLGFALKLFFVGMIALAFALPVVNAQNASFSGSQSSVKDGSKTVGFARIDTKGQITLDPTQPVQAVYQADMSHHGYQTKSAAQTFFASFSSPKVQYTVVDPNTVQVKLDLTQTGVGTWSVEDWNNHFASEVAAKQTSTK